MYHSRAFGFLAQRHFYMVPGRIYWPPCPFDLNISLGWWWGVLFKGRGGGMEARAGRDSKRKAPGVP